MFIDFDLDRANSDTDAIAEALLRSFVGVPTDDDVELLVQSYGENWRQKLTAVKESPFGTLLNEL